MIGNVSDFRGFHAERGNALPSAATDADATAALIRGSDAVRRGWCLTVAETDSRVLDAAYAAAGFEITSNGLAEYPGFWVGQQSDRILTEVKGIKWETRERKGPAADALTPREVVSGILGEAAGSATKALMRS